MTTMSYQVLSLAFAGAPFATVALTALATLGMAALGMATTVPDEDDEEEEEEEETEEEEDEDAGEGGGEGGGEEPEAEVKAEDPAPTETSATGDAGGKAAAEKKAAEAKASSTAGATTPTGTVPETPAAGATTTAGTAASAAAGATSSPANAAAAAGTPEAAGTFVGFIRMIVGAFVSGTTAGVKASGGAGADGGTAGGVVSPQANPPAEAAPADAGATPGWKKALKVLIALAALALIAAIVVALIRYRSHSAMLAGAGSASANAPADSTAPVIPSDRDGTRSSSEGAKSLCPAGYTELEVARNSCQYLGWDGVTAPYEVNTQPEPGHLVVCRDKPVRDAVTGKSTLTLSQGCAICWPTKIPLGAEIAANDLTLPVMGQHADEFNQPGWYTDCRHDWVSRCGMQLKDPSCVKANADGSNDLKTCVFIVPRPVL